MYTYIIIMVKNQWENGCWNEHLNRHWYIIRRVVLNHLSVSKENQFNP